MDVDERSVGMTIKQRRKELGISRRSMAKRFHITVRQYKMIEDNTGDMNAFLYVAICELNKTQLVSLDI
jgi:transcriptional regulator with XRE-family HTH domain